MRAALLVPGGRQQRPRPAGRARARTSTRRSRATSSTAARFENFLAEQVVEGGHRPLRRPPRPGRRVRRRRARGHLDDREATTTLTIKARWVVDASGRAFILKKKLDLLEDNGHVVNASWFRLAGGLDLEDWADPDDEEFFDRMEERGLRMLSTNHICGEGYWVWLIPLSSGSISIGIVADPRFHPVGGDEHARRRARVDQGARAAARRVARRPPRPGRGLPQGRGLLVRQQAVVRRRPSAGAWSARRGRSSTPSTRRARTTSRCRTRSRTDLITRELDGEDVAERAEAHNDLYLNFFRVHLTFYEGQYEFWHNPLVMNVKIGGNNILYWGVARAAVLPPQVHRRRVHGRRAPGPRADLGRSPGRSRRCTASGTRSSPRSGRARWSPPPRSRRCSSGTWTWSAASTTRR